MKKVREITSLALIFAFLLSCFSGMFVTPVYADSENPSTKIVDYGTFTPSSTGGLGVGTNDEQYRWQSFTANATGKISQVKVYVNKKVDSGPALTDLIVEIYNTAGTQWGDNYWYLPTGEALARVEVQVSSIKFNGNTGDYVTVDFDVPVEEGTHYAVALTQKTLMVNGSDGSGEHYRWPTGTVAEATASGETGGKKNSSGWVPEFGTYWMQVTITEEDEQTPPEEDNKYVLDYTFENVNNGLELNVGFMGGFEGRYQSFTPQVDANLRKLSFVMFKKATDRVDAEPFGDVKVHLFASENKKPVGSPLKTVIVPTGNINNGTPTAIDFEYDGLEAGITYVIVFEPAPVWPDYNDAANYNTYAIARQEVNISERAGRLNADYSEGTGADNYHLWLKLEFVKPQTQEGRTSLIDFGTFAPGTGGLGVGTMDEIYRWQTFTADLTGSIEKITLQLNKRYENQPYSTYLTDLIVEIYETADNGSGKYLPVGQPLKRVVVSKDLFEFTVPTSGNNSVGKAVTFDVNCPGIVEGKRYAVALTQVELALNGITGEHYRWPFGTVAAAANEFSGKKTSGGWVEETQWIGTGWMKVYLSDRVDTTIRPRRIELDKSGFIYIPVGGQLTVNAQVFDQDDDPMEGVELEWSSNNTSVATVSNGVIDGLRAGKATVQVKAGSVITSLSVQIYDSYPNKIVGKPNISVKVGESVQLDYDVMDDFKNIRPQDKAGITYEIDGDIASVNGTNLTGLKPGSAQMAVRSGNLVKYVDVSVYEDSENLVEPAPGMVITSDVKFKPGIYNLGENGLIVGASDITIDGNGAVIVGGSGGVSRPVVPPQGNHMFYSGYPGMESVYTMRTLNKINLKDATSASLSYKVWYEIEDEWDIAAVRISTDGINYTSLQTPGMKTEIEGTYEGFKEMCPVYTGSSGGWVEETIDLSEYAGQEIHLLFILATDWAVVERGIYFDDIKVTKDGVVIFADDAENGTNKWLVSGFHATDGYIYSEKAFGGTGLYSKGYDNVTVRNLTLTNFNTGIYIDGGDNWLIEYCDLSDNYNDPSYGWGDGYPYGATRLVNLTNSVIRYNNGNNVWNGIYLHYGEKNKIYNNDFGICGNVCLKLWGSSYNEIYDNIFNWGLRMDPGETHARDSTSSLFEYNSHFNYIARNDFTHGGDGIFIRPLYGAPPMGNYFEENDTSWANNNAVESWAPGNVYVGNKANYSSYGFWLGGSDFTYLIDNEVYYNGGYASGARNAPEPFGNAGVSVVNGASSHFLMMGNDVQYNNGPALAIKYNNSLNPAYHWLVQNNILSNNANDPRGYRSYGVYTQHAHWVDIISNKIVSNGDVQLKEDGNTRNISLIGPNTEIISIGRPVANLAVSPAIMSQFADSHMDKIPQQIKDAEFGIVRIVYVSVKAGEEITFDASGSEDPQDLPLTYRWELGDGTVEVGPVVKHTYNTPGVYRAGLTVKNGELGDIFGFIVTVVPDGEELDGDAGASVWALTANDAVLETYTTHRVAGDKAVKVIANSGQDYKLTYPATKDLSVDFAEYANLSMFVEVNIERGLDENYKRPIIRLCKDGQNYFEYLPKKVFMDPINLPVSEPRYSYQNLILSLAGENDQFSRTMVGSLTLSDIKYIEIIAGPASNSKSTFAVDGMMLVGESAGTGTGVSPIISKPGTQAYPAGIGENLQEVSNLNAPLSNPITSTSGTLSRVVSKPDTNAWYGVDFGEARYVNTLEVYYLYEPDEQGVHTVVRPNSHTVQYWDGSTWKDVSNAVKRPSSPAANLNTITFDMVKTTKLRVVPVVPAGKAFSIYALRAFNTANLIGNAEGNTYPGRKASSSGSASPNLVSITICVSEKGETATRNLPLTDLVVALYNVEGNHAVGAPLVRKVVPKSDVNFGGLTTIELPYSGLIPGKRYAIAISQVETTGNGDQRNHYLWPTSSIPGVTEYYGKMTNMDTGDSFHENIGIGWLIVTMDKGVIDLSPGAPKAGGFGVGHKDELGRYQTFTVPMDDVYDTVDGSIEAGNGWSSEGFEGNVHWLDYETEKAYEIDTAVVYFDDTPAALPEKLTLEAFVDSDWIKVAELAGDEIQLMTEISFDKIITSQIRFTFEQAEGTYFTVREAELMAAQEKEEEPGGEEKPPVKPIPGPITGGIVDETEDEQFKVVVDEAGNANATLSEKWMKSVVDKALEEAQKTGGKAKVVIEVQVETDDVNSVEISIPKASVDILAEGNVKAVEVTSPVATIVFDEEAIAAICSQATEDVKIISVKVDPSELSDDVKAKVGDRPVYDFSVKSGGKTISEFGGNVTVIVPYTLKPGEDPNAVVVYFINDQGGLEIVRNCVYDPSTGTISFRTDHFSKYAVGYNKVTFKDVTPGSWYYDAVTFIAARRITEGTGDGNYSPADALTRGQFIVMLMRAYGLEPDADPKDNFADAGNTYYTGYLAAAKRLRISAGIGNNLFGPELKITRQEMFTLLYNILKHLDELPEGTSGKKASDFSDADLVASWAKEAVSLLVEKGLISSDGNKLKPLDTANRAELAQLLYNILAR